MASHPTISVVMTTYNHEKFISEAVESILNQTYEDFEFIIINDGSTDSTMDIIAQYDDPRIIVLTQENSGPSIAFNNGLDKSRGDYIALMSGDDVSFPNRLESQYHQIAAQDLDIIFSLPVIIGPNSNVLNSIVCHWFFGSQFKSNEELIREFFYRGNFFCASSAFIRRPVIEEVGYFERGLIQLQDFDYWLRACKLEKRFKIFTNPLIKYRHLFGNNLSDTNRNSARSSYETLAIYKNFFNGMPGAMFEKAFGDEVFGGINYESLPIDFKKAALLIHHPLKTIKQLGFEQFISLLNNDSSYSEFTRNPENSIIDFFEIEKPKNTLISEGDTKGKLKAVIKKLRSPDDNAKVSLSMRASDNNLMEYLQKGENKKAIEIIRGRHILHPEKSTWKTIKRLFNKVFDFIKNGLKRFYTDFIQKIFVRTTKNIAYDVYELESLYQYSKNNKTLHYEGEAEIIHLEQPKLLNVEENSLESGKAFCPKPYISILNDMIVTGGSDYMITPDGLLLNDELVEYASKDFGIKSPFVEFRYEDKLILGYEKMKHPIKVDEGIFISSGHDFNYFHWIVECLPKVVFIDQFEEFKDLPLIIVKGLHPNLLTALDFCNVNKRKIIQIVYGKPHKINRLVFPSALSRIVDRYQGELQFDDDIILSKKWISQVRQLFLKDQNLEEKPWRKLFLTRKSGIRAIPNIDQIEKALLERNFEIVDLNNVAFDYQIELFSQAKTIVAPTGAAITNLIFCQPGTKVIVFMSDHDISNYYLWTQLGNIFDLDISIFIGKRLYNLTNIYSVHDDYKIDLEKLLETI